ncbi:proteasome complex subunit Rpn13 ubiquitin receptor-domain-containing protein [Ilyonectria robusta]|uniref:proteasome complex subunit Rpn13 ubiquitin receptor-domain-containing protein n=1 Tax=Ilyonectria robusta TaxID=1079257 RepID=UPI001E8D6EF2|nr:proteasome complex subunit Rpn13 ubiquitin receptor-domain-containing protein [Ilyonectria robusta]KAH6997877.1 proteasome complex subunit Rpn13 ubiquitin receptor-domain-containing protein [Ilyonectria sp. MPI-CAGE-AT-0026]KAH8737057.1 proteasome complex subunit Rpn13 ubiquitin receptor-domain-containing protein [Ilyonectria robusta]
MPISPIITFKAGQCEVDTSSKPFKVKPQPEPGYIYLYSEDDLVHFCWRKRSDSLDEPELDLIMVPTDGSFVPYEYKTTPQPTSKTNGRIFALRFSSSSQRYLFWLQSKPQGRNGDPSHFSPRDRKIGEIVHLLLQGEEVDVTSELAAVRNTDDRPDDDDDETMEDVEGHRDQHTHRGSGSGGAGPGATGGDIREEGEGSREGGADGARAVSSSAPDAAAAVRNFLDSLRDQSGLSGGQRQHGAEKPYPYLNHLLPTSITVPMIDAAPVEFADALISFLPPAVIVLATGAPDAIDGKAEPSAAAVEAAKASLTLEDKRSLLKKVLRSPQFNQALGTLTMAIRDGGLPSIAEALGVKVQNGGYIPGGGMPLGGGHAVEAFVEGVKKTAQEEKK